MRIIKVLGFGASYVRGLTIPVYSKHVLITGQVGTAKIKSISSSRSEHKFDMKSGRHDRHTKCDNVSKTLHTKNYIVTAFYITSQ